MLYELAAALAGHIDDSVIPRQPCGGLLEHLSRVLALTPGSANAEWAARLARRPAIPVSSCRRRGGSGRQPGCWPPGSRPST